MSAAVKYILGISAYYHDSAAALLRDGEIIAAAQEERFTRKKHDSVFPREAITYCLSEAKISFSELHAVVFYDKPFIKFERLLETYLSYAPQGFPSFVMAMPVWMKEKLFLKSTLKREFKKFLPEGSNDLPSLWFTEHHQAHAASAFFPSPYSSAAVLCLDGVGEWATTTAWHGQKNKLQALWEIRFPHSLGLLYSAFTYYAGFKVNSGEYKLMGLAPYGEPKYVNKIYDNLIDVKADGTFRLNLDFFDYMTGLKMTNQKFAALFGGSPRKAESLITQREMDLARSIQVVTEEIVLKLASTIHKETGEENLCLAGGVALNCVANGRLLREGAFRNLWIQPAAGDAGGALGAALAGWHQFMEMPREPSESMDAMKGSFLGPKFSSSEIEELLKTKGAVYERLEEEDLLQEVSKLLASGAVVGWFKGRMEFGPRALGARSILGDARNKEMQSRMNLKIKFRESFRPFAPIVLREDVQDFFEMDADSPYMLLVAPVQKALRLEPTKEEKGLFGVDRLRMPRSTIPAVTHVDYSARVQTVDEERNPSLTALLRKFKEQTGVGLLVNTSFNVRGEPPVCSPEDAYRCFLRTEMDYLVLEDCILNRKKQPSSLWQREHFAKMEMD